MWGDVFPRCGDLVWGESKDPAKFLWRGLWISYLDVSLDQAKLNRPFDSPPATVDIKFVVNAFGVSPHRT